MPAKNRNVKRTDSTDETGCLIPAAGREQETGVTSTVTSSVPNKQRHSSPGRSISARSALRATAAATSVYRNEEGEGEAEADLEADPEDPDPDPDRDLAETDTSETLDPGNQEPSEEATPSGEREHEQDKSGTARKTSLTSGGSSTNRSRGSSGKLQQKVVYYQNRFISIPVGPAPRTAGSAGKTAEGHGVGDNARGGSAAGEARDARAARTVTRTTRTAPNGSPGRAAAHGHTPGTGTTMNAIVADDSSVTITMQSPDPDSIRTEFQGPGPSSRSRGGRFSSKQKSPSVFKKIAKFLQDNRLKGETAKKLRTMNKTQNASNQRLKKILNIIFVTTGVCLLVAVVIVIIYTAFADLDTKGDNTNKTAAAVAPPVAETSMMFEYITVAPPVVWPDSEYYDYAEWEKQREHRRSSWDTGYDDDYDDYENV